MLSTFSKTIFLPVLCFLFRLLTQSSSLIFPDWAVQCFLCSHLTTTRSLHLHEKSKMHKAQLGRCVCLQHRAWHPFDLNELMHFFSIPAVSKGWKMIQSQQSGEAILFLVGRDGSYTEISYAVSVGLKSKCSFRDFVAICMSFLVWANFSLLLVQIFLLLAAQ